MLGSVKSQIGHTKCAAGIAGLVKAAYALHAGVRPPTGPIKVPNPGWEASTSPFFFDHVLSMRLTYFTSSGRIWDRMPWEARLQFLYAVFFTFSGVGFLLDLANPRPGRIAHIVFWF